ncbi:MAG: hypothetical protein VW445_13430, partial [Rhodospirillaceae bacterium]
PFRSLSSSTRAIESPIAAFDVTFDFIDFYYLDLLSKRIPAICVAEVTYKLSLTEEPFSREFIQ